MRFHLSKDAALKDLFIWDEIANKKRPTDNTKNKCEWDFRMRVFFNIKSINIKGDGVEGISRLLSFYLILYMLLRLRAEH